jgi:hypothetical protein
MAYNTDGSRTGITMDLSLQNYDNAGTALSFLRSTAQPSISLVKDLTTTPNGIAMNPTGLAYNNGTTTTSTSWDDLSTRIAQLSAVAPNGLNATLLAVNNTISIQNADTAPTRVINTSAEDGTGGTHFGVAWVGNTLPFVMETLDATPLQVKDTSFVLLDSVAPLTTTMTATDLTSGATTRTWADIIASSGSTNTLDQVLSNGNTATGTYANINLVDTDVGGALNPILNLQNTNATGSVALEVYKNKPTAGVAGDVLFNQSVFGKDAGNLKQEYTRISHTIRDSSIGGEDGSIEFSCFVNNVINTFIQINGNQNEINFLKPLDMEGHNIRTSTGDLSILTTTSSGNGNMTISTNGTNAVGDITISAKNNMVLSCGASPDTIDLQGGVKMTNGRQITFTNASNSDTGFAQSQAFTITDGIETGSIQKGTIQTTTATTSNTMTPTKLFINDTTNNRSITLDNNPNSNENRLDLFKNDGGGIVAQSGISNQNNNQSLFITQSLSSGSTNKTIQLQNTASGALIYDNTEDTNGLTIVSNNTNLTLQTSSITAGRGDIVIAPSQNGSANGQLIFTGGSLEDTTSTGSSGKYLKIVLNGTTYKIPLDNN